MVDPDRPDYLSRPGPRADHRGLAARHARGRHGGRPAVLTGHKLQVAQEMYRCGQYTVAVIAKTLGVSRASNDRRYRVMAPCLTATGPSGGRELGKVD
jgi:hypothetical protein